MAILIFGSVQIEPRRKLDGARFDYPFKTYSSVLIVLYTNCYGFWIQDCCQYHQAKDGDGWVENKGSLDFDRLHKV